MQICHHRIFASKLHGHTLLFSTDKRTKLTAQQQQNVVVLYYYYG